MAVQMHFADLHLMDSENILDLRDQVTRPRSHCLNLALAYVNTAIDSEIYSKATREQFVFLEICASYVRYFDGKLAMVKLSAIPKITESMPDVDERTALSSIRGKSLRKLLNDIRRDWLTLFDKECAGKDRRDEDWVALVWDLFCTAGIKDRTNSSGGSMPALEDEIVKMIEKIDNATAVQRMLYNFWLEIRDIEVAENDHMTYAHHLGDIKAGLLDRFKELGQDLRAKFDAEPYADFLPGCEELRTVAVALQDMQAIYENYYGKIGAVEDETEHHDM